ncbi:MAG: hypothetical protein ACC628_28370 [Pirellulaceae bacterium]
MKNAALITIHGMGRTKPNYEQDFKREMRRRLGSRWNRLHFDKVYYQGLLQPNEDRVWRRVSGRLSWDTLREFLLFGFADAAGLETRKHAPDSIYTQSQVIIATVLFAARTKLGGDKPVVIIAQSLGGQVLSNYLWDAQKYQANPGSVDIGFWRDPHAFAQQIAGRNSFTADELRFLAGGTLRYLYTTGCNIPIFVAAHAVSQIIPIKKTRPDFEWHNFYDKDDVLGWPLEDLSPAYGNLVTDTRINAGQGIIGWLFKSWNPASHGEYWGDDDVLDGLEARLLALL